jgi:hypothetical protein
MKNSKWNCDSKPSAIDPTTSITPFYLEKSPNTMLIDFPGRYEFGTLSSSFFSHFRLFISDEINPLWSACHVDGLELVSFVIITLDWQYINAEQKKVIDNICQKGIPFIICMNKADNLYRECQNLPKDQIRFRMEQILKEKIAKLENANVRPENTFLTCFNPSTLSEEQRAHMYASGVLDIVAVSLKIAELLKGIGMDGEQIMNSVARTPVPYDMNFQMSDNEKIETDVLIRLLLMHKTLQGDPHPSVKGQYKSIRLLKKGGQGTVFLVHNVATHRETVLKKIYCCDDEDLNKAYKEVFEEKKFSFFVSASDSKSSL